jgi:LysM repeat protein
MVQPRGFTPSTRPVDTFVSQSTVAPINITSPLNQVAQSLAIIEPALQKYIGQEIDKVKAAEIKEAESAGERAGTDGFTATEKLLYPEEINLETTQGQIAKKLNDLTKKGLAEEAEFIRGQNPWYAPAFYKAKSTALGLNLKNAWLKELETTRVIDPADGELKPLAAFPFSSPQVQEYVARKRNARVEQLDMPEFYVKNFFLSQIDDGVKGFQAQHAKDNSAYKVDKLKKIGAVQLDQIIASYFIDESQDRAFIKNELKLFVEDIRSQYVGEEFTKEMGNYTDQIMNFAVTMANNKAGGLSRFANARDFLEEFTSLFPTYSLGTKKVPDGKGGFKLVKVENTRNSITNTKEFRKKLNTAIGAIDKAENRFYDYKDKIQESENINRAREILTKENPTDEDKEELRVLQSQDKATRTFVKNNQEIIAKDSVLQQQLITNRIDNGEYNNKQLAQAYIDLAYEQSFKTNADLEWKRKSLKDLDTSLDKERRFADSVSSKIITNLERIYTKRTDLDSDELDRIEDLLFAIPKKIRDYKTTKRLFGDNLQVNEEGVEIDVPRYPTDTEVIDFGDKVQDQSKRIIQGNRTLQSFASPEAVNNETLQREINTKVQKERIRTLRLTVGSLYANSDIDDQGLKIKPSLADVEEQYDYAGEISIDEIFETYQDAAGNYDPLYQDDLRQFLKRVDLSNEEIEAYGLREFVVEPVQIEYDKFIKSKTKKEQVSEEVVKEIQEQTPMTTTENVDNSSVSDETTDEKPSDTGNEDEFIKANERDEIVNPKDLRKSQLPLNDVQIAQGQKIVSDVISNLGGQEGDLIAMANTPQTEEKTYTVQSGDNLSVIADKYEGVSYPEIIQFNNFTEDQANNLSIGQKIRIPEPKPRESKEELVNRLNKVLEDVDTRQRFSQDLIKQMLSAVGFNDEQTRIMGAVAMAESAGDSNADTVKSGLDPLKKNEFSLGLMQINMLPEFLPERLPLFEIESTDELYDPIINVIAAKRLYDKYGFGAWESYNTGKYKDFLTD